MSLYDAKAEATVKVFLKNPLRIAEANIFYTWKIFCVYTFLCSELFCVMVWYGILEFNVPLDTV